MEYIDIVNELGEPTGKIVDRQTAHKEGLMHRTSHVWILRRKKDKIEVLLQKRCMEKESFPGCFDISSAGHIPASFGFRESAIRELNEELGVHAKEEDLIEVGYRISDTHSEFHGIPYNNIEYAKVFVLWLDLEESDFVLQKEEVECVKWFEYNECLTSIKEKKLENCINLMEFEMLKRVYE